MFPALSFQEYSKVTPMPTDIFKGFKEHSVAEFFKKNRQMLGFTGKVRSLTVIVHELVTNSITWDTPTVVRIDGNIEVCRIGELVDKLMEKNKVVSSLAGEMESLRHFKKFEVLCFDKKELKLKFKEVKSIHRHRMKKDERLIKLKLVGGRSVEITKHHSIFTLRDGKVMPLKGEDVQIGDYIVVPRKSWAGLENKTEINILEEALKISDEKLAEFSIFGVKDILYRDGELLDKIKMPLSTWQKNHDFYANYMKCDRLPVRLLRALTAEERAVFYRCKVGYKQTKQGKIDCIIQLSPELMQFLGLYVAEGNTRKTLASLPYPLALMKKSLSGSQKT